MRSSDDDVTSSSTSSSTCPPAADNSTSRNTNASVAPAASAPAAASASGDVEYRVSWVVIDGELTFFRRGQQLIIWSAIDPVAPAEVEPVLHTLTKEEVIRRLGMAAQAAGLLVPSRSVVLLEDPMSAKLRPCPRPLKFTECDICCHLRDRINATTDMVEKGALHEEKRDHLEKIRASRATYFIRQELAQADPRRYMTLVVDSMDSTATDRHIIGAISHSRRRRAFMFVGSNRFNRRTNVTIEIVHRVLLAILEAEGGLPSVLHLQLDNTSNQCKSHWLVGCLSLLVAYGVFEQVTMAYLPVGHTIDEIDQLFSLVAFREID